MESIKDWLLQELLSRYQIPKKLARGWVENEQLLLLLDGLDEVKDDRQKDCVQAINKFMQDHRRTKIVVCSRREDYELLKVKLKLLGAIYILPLTSEQVNQYLEKAEEVGDQLQVLKTLLRENRIMRKLAESPVLLSVMTLTYKDKKIEEVLRPTGSEKEHIRDLFDAYIKRMFSQETLGKPTEYKPPYKNEKTKFWLKWLAQLMARTSQSEFLIEQIQPSCLNEVGNNSFLLLWVYPIGVMLIVYLVVGLLFIPTLFYKGIKEQFWLSGWILVPLYFVCCGLISSSVSILIYQCLKKINQYNKRSNSEMSNKPTSITKSIIINGIINGSIVTIIYSTLISFLAKTQPDYPLLENAPIVFPIAFAIFSSIWEISNSKILQINPVQKLKASPKKMTINLFVFIILVLLFAVLYQIRNLIIWQSLDWDSLHRLMLVLVPVGICFVIFGGFETPAKIKKEEQTKPNQGIWDSVKNMLFSMMVVIPIVAIVGFAWAKYTKFIPPYIALSYGIFLGIIGGILIFGQGSGIACIKHFILRLILYINGYLPWDYASFLDYTTARGFLQKTGGSYIFVHRKLLEHFAQMK